MKLVVGSHKCLEIGSIHSSLYDQHRIFHKAHFFKVICESNIEEWIKCMKDLGSEPFLEEIAMPCQYYYEIQTD